MRRPSIVDVARAGSILGVLGLVAVLILLLPSPGYRPSRLYFFVLVGAVGAIGAFGALLRRATLLGAGGVGLFLLGFWQFVLGLVMVPVAIVLVLTALLVRDARDERGADSTEERESAS